MNRHQNSADTQLSKTEYNKFDALFYGSETAIVLYRGPEMIYEMFNDKYQDLYPGRELLGKTFHEAVPELKDTQFPIILKKVFETGEPYVSHEGLARIYNQKTNKFEDRYFDTTFSRINYGDSEPFRIMATPREVTDRVMSRLKLEETVRELEEEKDLREQFISALSHDLRTPLSIAKISTMILTRKVDDQEVVNEMAERIVVNINRVDRMIRDMLDANRIKAGQALPISVQECRLDTTIAYVVKDLEELYNTKIKIFNSIGAIEGMWDIMAIHRLVENLISNAIKYRTPDTEVTIALDIKESFATIAVHNDGKPISLEDQKTLFNLYQRSTSAIKSEQHGWGVGLTLVKALSEAHNGSVTVTSEPDFGTTFTIKLPL